MSEQPVSEFEERLRTLLARTAEAVPPDADLSARVLRLARVRDTRRTDGIVGPRHAHVLATVAAVVVVALLAGVLTFGRPGGSRRPAGGVTGAPTTTATATDAPLQVTEPPTCDPGNLLNPPSPPVGTPTGTPTGTPADHSVAVGRHASLHGITITIDRAYADATQTVISYHMHTNINPPSPVFPVLLDAQGHRYAMMFGDWDIQRGAFFTFSPLPPQELGTPQTLTFFTQQMQLADPTGPGAMVDGPWQIPFNLTPAASSADALRNTPLTHNGLTIQPLQLDVALGGSGLDGVAGGARVVVRISGLVPAMHLRDLSGFNQASGLNGYGSGGCGGGTLLLVLPKGQQIAPSYVHSLGQTVPATPAEDQAALAQTVGPSGTADLEALFFAPIPAGTRVTLYLDHAPAQFAGAATSSQISGPWEFRLQPSA